MESLDAMVNWYNLEFDDNDGNLQKIPHVLTDSQSVGDVVDGVRVQKPSLPSPATAIVGLPTPCVETPYKQQEISSQVANILQ